MVRQLHSVPDEDRAVVDATEETFDEARRLESEFSREAVVRSHATELQQGDVQGCRTGQEDDGESSMGWRDGRCQRSRIW